MQLKMKSLKVRSWVMYSFSGLNILYVISLMAQTIPPSFVEIGPKLRVVAPLKWEWPKTAKNRGEPQKMTPSSETENFLGVVPMGKL